MPNYYREVFTALAENENVQLQIEASMNYWVEVSRNEALIELTRGTRIRVKPGIILHEISPSMMALEALKAVELWVCNPTLESAKDLASKIKDAITALEK